MLEFSPTFMIFRWKREGFINVLKRDMRAFLVCLKWKNEGDGKGSRPSLRREEREERLRSLLNG